MFCPPAVRERYAKKYGIKKVEAYERQMLEQQRFNKNDNSNGKKKMSIKSFVRGSRKNKNDDNSTTKNQNNDVESSVVFWANENDIDFDPTNSPKKKYDNDRHIDEKYLDDEFDAYGDSTSSDDMDSKNDGLYADSSDSGGDDNDDMIGNTKQNHSTKNKNDLWSLPNDTAIKQLQKNYTSSTTTPTRTTPQQQQQQQQNVVGIFVTAFQGLNLFSPDFFKSSSNQPPTPHQPNDSKSYYNSKIVSSPATNNKNNEDEERKRIEQQKRAAELVAALGLFEETYYDAPSEEHHQLHPNDYITSSSSFTLSPPEITRITSSQSTSNSPRPKTSPESEPETKATPLSKISFDDNPPSPARMRPSPTTTTPESHTPVKEKLSTSYEIPEDGESNDELNVSELTLTKRLQQRTFVVTTNDGDEDDPYSRYTYDNDAKDDDEDDDDDIDDDIEAASAVDDYNNLAITPQTLSFEAFGDSKSVGSYHQKKSDNYNNKSPFRGMNISILAKTSTTLSLMDDERTAKSEPSPSQKRMLTNHYAKMKHDGRRSIPIVHHHDDNDDDEVVDLELLNEDHDGSDDHDDDDDDDDDDHDMEEEKLEDGTFIRKGKKAKNGGSGVDHIGANVFIASEKKANYYGSLHSSCSALYSRRRTTNRRSHHRSISSGGSSHHPPPNHLSSNSMSRILGTSYSNSLYNIDEDSVVEDDIIKETVMNDTNMVNRLMLRSNTMWKDEKGKTIIQNGRSTTTNTIPDFKPRFEEDNDDDDNRYHHHHKENLEGGGSGSDLVSVHSSSEPPQLHSTSSTDEDDHSSHQLLGNNHAMMDPTSAMMVSTDDDCTIKTTSTSSSSTQQQHHQQCLTMNSSGIPSRSSTNHLSSNRHSTSSTTFCFGGIQLLSPSLFQSMEDANKEIVHQGNYQRVSDSTTSTLNTSAQGNDSAYSAVSSKSVDNSVKQKRSSKKIIPSPLSSMVHPMKREYFTSHLDDTNDIDNQSSYSTGSSSRQGGEIAATRTKNTELSDYKVKPSEPENVTKQNNTEFSEYKKRKEPDNVVSPGRKSGKLGDDTLSLQMDQYRIVGKSPNHQSRSRLSSSFRSTAHSSSTKDTLDSPNNGRLTYKLGSGIKDISKEDRIRLHALLPSRPDLSVPKEVTAPTKSLSPEEEQTGSPANDTKDSIPKENLITLGESKMRLISSLSITSSSPRRFQSPFDTKNRRIAILLIEPTQKIFEVVFLDSTINLREMTVGDALAKARSNAIDPTLSEQKYVSLCNEQQEIAAPMLAVDFLLKPSSLINKASGSANDENDKKKLQKLKHQTVLLVAVPLGYTADQMQKIKSLLWRNPKTARWWKQHDPLRPTKSRSDKNNMVHSTSCSNLTHHSDHVNVKSRSAPTTPNKIETQSEHVTNKEARSMSF